MNGNEDGMVGNQKEERICAVRTDGRYDSKELFL